MLHILGNVSVLIDRKTLVTVNIELNTPKYRIYVLDTSMRQDGQTLLCRT